MSIRKLLVPTDSSKVVVHAFREVPFAVSAVFDGFC